MPWPPISPCACTAGFWRWQMRNILLDSFVQFAAGRNEIPHPQASRDRLGRSGDIRGSGATSGLERSAGFARHVRVEDDRHELPPANYFKIGTARHGACRHIYSSDEIRSPFSKPLKSTPSSWRNQSSDVHHADRAAGRHFGLRVSEGAGTEICRHHGRWPADSGNQVPKNPPGATCTTLRAQGCITLLDAPS